MNVSPEQAAVLDDLCRQVAESDRWLPQPGQAVRDPKSGEVWRRLAPAWWVGSYVGWRLADADLELIRTGLYFPIGCSELQRALAAGPDWRDEVTGLGLLADLPDHALVRLRSDFDSTDVEWYVAAPDENVFNKTYSTRIEAVLRAWLKVFGGA